MGRIHHELVGAATAAGVAGVSGGHHEQPVRAQRPGRDRHGDAPDRRRRGPLAELELADHLRRQIERLLDEMGEIRTGTPIDWLPLSGLGGH